MLFRFDRKHTIQHAPTIYPAHTLWAAISTIALRDRTCNSRPTPECALWSIHFDVGSISLFLPYRNSLRISYQPQHRHRWRPTTIRIICIAQARSRLITGNGHCSLISQHFSQPQCQQFSQVKQLSQLSYRYAETDSSTACMQPELSPSPP